MDSRHLRSILLNLQHRLSDHDRERLHFYLKNDVPRPVGDDSTLNGTLKLWQSIFDEQKITEHDFTLLIDAFKQIRCFDAVDLLKEHQRRMKLSGCNESTQSLAFIMPSMIGDFLSNDEDDDKGPTNEFILNKINHNNNQNNDNHLIDSNNIKIDLAIINEDTESLLSSRKSKSRTVLFTKKCFILPSISFLLTLAILIVVLIQGMNRIHSLEADLQKKQILITKTQNQNNQTIRQSKNLILEKNAAIESLNKTLVELNYTNMLIAQRLVAVIKEKEEPLNRTLEGSNLQQNEMMKRWKNLLLEKNADIERFNKTLIDSKNERKTLLIKAGRKFGGDGGRNFDDSSTLRFTIAHYLSGVIYSNLDDLTSCQFIYTSSHDNQSRIESRTHGNNGATINSTYQYYLDDDERIQQVFVKSGYTNIVYLNNAMPPVKMKIVIGLKFVTTHGRFIPPDADFMDDNAESESFSGHILAYATGSSSLLIDQLQFVWYRTKN